ncbi:ribonuclease H-like domain-containing protein [bacterium]|nr:ribonuclease H-like domain-containing protein [bacterium]
MLTHTFVHVPGLGAVSERRLWERGVLTWEDALGLERLPPGVRGGAKLATWLKMSIAQHARRDAKFFCHALPTSERWRLFSEFRAETAYLDIETTGLGSPDDHITTIALWDGATLKTYVHGQNLDEFQDDIEAYRLLVTYNGASFDLPFLRRQFRIRLDGAHIDLRFVLSGMGLTGGLKRVERSLGLERGLVADLDGYDAVLLWQEWQDTKEQGALDTLLAYNCMDTVVLERLLVFAHNRKVEATPLAVGHTLPPAPEADILHEADPGAIAAIRRRRWGGWE